MLEPLLLSPDIFSPSQLQSRGNRAVLSGLLREIGKAGSILDLSGGLILKKIIRILDESDSTVTRSLKERLKNLKKRNRIVQVDLLREYTNNEQISELVLVEGIKTQIERLLYADEVYEIEKYACIEKNHYLDVNDEDWWEKYTQQSVSCDMSEQSLEKFLKPVLKYAKRLSLIDPYFTCYDQNFRNESHLKTIELILSCINKAKMKEIVIHTSLKSMPKEVRLNEYYKSWDDTIVRLDLDFQFDVFIWEDLPNRERFHNRYLLTNQASFGNPEGWACWQKPQKSYIHLLDFEGNTDETNHLATTFNSAKVKILKGVKLISNYE